MAIRDVQDADLGGLLVCFERVGRDLLPVLAHARSTVVPASELETHRVENEFTGGIGNAS